MRIFFYLLLTASAAFPASQAPLTPVAQRQPAPQFVLKDASGKTVEFQKYRGKVVLLDFWADLVYGLQRGDAVVRSTPAGLRPTRLCGGWCFPR